MGILGAAAAVLRPFVAGKRRFGESRRVGTNRMMFRGRFFGSTFAGMRDLLPLSAVALFVVVSLASGPGFAQQQDPPLNSTEEQGSGLPPGQVPAVLKTKEVDFIYRTTSTPLACDQLRNRVANVLRAVGARDDIQVTARECDSFLAPDPRSRPSRSGPNVSGTFEPNVWIKVNADDTVRIMLTMLEMGQGVMTRIFEPSSGGDLTNQNDRLSERMHMTRADRYDRNRSQTTPVHIQLMVPVVITPEIVEEAERDKSRRALISRVQGNPSASMDDPIYFAAERRQVKLSHETIELEAMDCELLEEMRRTVFRELDLKVTSGSLSCDQESYIRPSLTVEALLPVGIEMPGERKQRERAEKAAQSKEEKPSQ